MVEKGGSILRPCDVMNTETRVLDTKSAPSDIANIPQGIEAKQL